MAKNWQLSEGNVTGNGPADWNVQRVDHAYLVRLTNFALK